VTMIRPAAPGPPASAAPAESAPPPAPPGGDPGDPGVFAEGPPFPPAPPPPAGAPAGRRGSPVVRGRTAARVGDRARAGCPAAARVTGVVGAAAAAAG